MRPSFIVCGYGVPADISKDQNYDIYLRTIFNRLFEWCLETGSWNPVIVFSGGKTDMHPPYKRTEAGEMIKRFKELMQRPAVKARVRAWTLLPEPKGLSTLDNFLYGKEVLRGRSLDAEQVQIFCEATRTKRVSSIARKLFKRSYVFPIDFDQSANRYIDTEMRQKMEREALKFDRWALKSPDNLKRHRELFKEKMAFLRKAGPEGHVEAVRAWWDEQLKKIDV